MIKQITVKSDETLGPALKSLRIERGLTLNDLAKATGVSKSAISKYENDKRIPTMGVFGRLTEALDVDVLLVGR